VFTATWPSPYPKSTLILGPWRPNKAQATTKRKANRALRAVVPAKLNWSR